MIVFFEGVSGWYSLAGGPVALLCGHALAVGVNFSGGPATDVGCIMDDVTVMRIIVVVVVVVMVVIMMTMAMTKQPKPESCIGQTTTATLRRRENDAILPNNHACIAFSIPCDHTSTAGSCTICPLASAGAMWVTPRTPSMMYVSHLMFVKKAFGF